MLLHGTVLYCIVLHCIVWYLMLSYGIQFHCTALHAIALLASACGLCLARRLFSSYILYIDPTYTSDCTFIWDRSLLAFTKKPFLKGFLPKQSFIIYIPCFQKIHFLPKFLFSESRLLHFTETFLAELLLTMFSDISPTSATQRTFLYIISSQGCFISPETFLSTFLLLSFYGTLTVTLKLFNCE